MMQTSEAHDGEGKYPLLMPEVILTAALDSVKVYLNREGVRRKKLDERGEIERGRTRKMRSEEQQTDVC